MSADWISIENLPLDLQGHEYAESTISAASWILYKLSAEKYPGISTTTEWYGYDKAQCGPCHYTYPMTHSHVNPYILRDSPQNIKLFTRYSPILSVSSVTERGVVLPEHSYSPVNRGYLVKTDRTSWDFDRGVTVEYTHGVNPPEAGRQAAITFTIELLKYIDNDPSCGLPTGVSSVSRQGIDYAILNPHDFISDGKTGLQLVDLFLQATNPIRAKKKPKVFSVNQPRGERYR